MSIQVQRQYAQLVTGMMPLAGIKSHTPFISNFRCIICGDSKTNATKKRGYLIERGSSIGYTCHNCGANLSLASFMKDNFYELFRNYWIDILDDRKQYEPIKPVEKQAVVVDNDRKSIKKVIDLPATHPAVKYILSRQLPVEKLPEIFFTDKFYQYINKIVPDKFSDELVKKYEHSRIILPITDSNGNWVGVIGRSLKENDASRYLTIKFSADVDKIYGLDKVDRRKHIFVLEGAFDSMFVDNSVAMAGTDAKLDEIFIDKQSLTIILDNEPRNKEVVNKYVKYISRGYQLVIWPHNIMSKDINQMIIKKELDATNINQVIKENTFSGLQATISLNKWKLV